MENATQTTTERITTNEQAEAWLQANGYEHIEIVDGMVTVEHECYRCGGSGCFPFYRRIDGGRCFACKGLASVTVTLTVKAYAQKEKRKATARAKAQAKAAAKRAAWVERNLEDQRNWCELNGYGRITFEERREQRKAEQLTKGHAGTVGKREVFTLTLEHILTFDFEGNYGVSFLYLMTDTEGRSFAWRTASGLDWKKGATKAVKATVKEHGTVRKTGVKQTMITRVKAI